MKKNKLFVPVLLILIMLTSWGCDKFDLNQDDLTLSGDFSIFKTYVSVKYLDAEIQELVGLSESANLSIEVLTDEADLISTSTGEYKTSFNADIGLLSFALNPYSKVPSLVEPIDLLIKTTSEDYLEHFSTIRISEERTYSYEVQLINKVNPPEGVSVEENEDVGETSDTGETKEDITIETEDDEVEIEIPSGTILTTEDGEALTGSVSVQIVSVDVTDESGLENLPGLNQPMVTESGETISLKSPLAYTSIDITDESGRKAARIVGQEMKITTTLPSGVTNPRTQKELAPGDAVPSFGFNKENAEWFFLGNEIVSEADGKLVVIKVISSMKSGTPSNFNQIVYNLEEIPTLDYLIEYTTDLSPMSMAFQYQVFGVDGAVASVGAGTISVPSGTTTSAFTIPNVQDLSDQSIGDFNLSFSSSAASFNPNPLTKGDLTSILGNPGFHVDITGNLVAPTTTDVYVKLVLECKNATVSDLPGFYVFISGTGFSGSEQIFIDQSRITLPYVHGTEPGGTWQGRLMFGDVIYPEYGDPALSLSSSAFEIIDGKVTFVYTPTTDQCTELARILGI